MAGRTRKALALTEMAAPVKGVNKRKIWTDSKTSPAKLTGTVSFESPEPKRSHYFTKNDLQNRLGQEFFNQSCISLAKALLGKVSLSSHWFNSHVILLDRFLKAMMICGGYLSSKIPKGSFPLEFFRITINFEKFQRNSLNYYFKYWFQKSFPYCFLILQFFVFGVKK